MNKIGIFNKTYPYNKMVTDIFSPPLVSHWQMDKLIRTVGHIATKT